MAEARPILRRVLTGKVTAQPQADGGYRFEAPATLGGLFEGLVQTWVPGGRTEGLYTLRLEGRVA